MNFFCNITDKTQKTHSPDALLCRRNALACGTASILTIVTFNYGLIPSPAWAEDKSNGQKEEGDSGVIGAIKSLFDPNEKTKSGKVLPKACLKSAREVVKNLRESLKEDPKDVAKFRRTADAAKESRLLEQLGGTTNCGRRGILCGTGEGNQIVS